MKEILKMNTQIEDTEQRILGLLAGDSISDDARDYILHLVKCYGIEKCARLDHNDHIGLSVFENAKGEQSLHYGDYGDSFRGSIDALFCGINEILDAAEAADEVPSWWPDEATVISVDCKWNGYGERYMTKEAAEYVQEN